MKLTDYREKLRLLKEERTRENALAASNLSRSLRLMCWAPAYEQQARQLAKEADDFAWEVARISRQPRWIGQNASGNPYPIA